jgi:hypothetical protein
LFVASSSSSSCCWWSCFLGTSSLSLFAPEIAQKTFKISVKLLQKNQRENDPKKTPKLARNCSKDFQNQHENAQKTSKISLHSKITTAMR